MSTIRQVDIRIAQNSYTLAAEAEQEGHVTQLAAEIDQRAKGVKERMPRAGENMILVMTALMLADELYEARQEAGMLHEKLATGLTLQRGEDEANFLPSAGQVAHHLAGAMNDIADQIDEIARTVEKKPA